MRTILILSSYLQNATHFMLALVVQKISHFSTQTILYKTALMKELRVLNKSEQYVAQYQTLNSFN